MKAEWIALTLALALAPLCSAANWPMWRGPDGDGTCEESGLPVKWGATENVAWKVPLPERGNSTPVVWGDRVFVTQAIEDEGKRLLFCFDRRDGTLLWESGTVYHEPELTHATNPHCSGSPATDGERVVVSFASAGVFCYGVDGALLWERTDLGKQHHIWGGGTSPVIHGGRAYLNFGPGENTVLYCFDMATGETVWRHEEPGGASGEAGKKEWLGSWADPILRAVGSHGELLMSFPGRACGFDPVTGAELWSCDGLTPLIYNSPLFSDGVMVQMCGFGGAGLAVRAGGRGDVTGTHRVWLVPRVPQRIGSGVIRDGHLYTLTDAGIVECRELKSGETIFQERLKGNNWSSLVLSADGNCYAANQLGDCFVFRASPEFELLATNPMGEKIIGSIAVSGGQLFIRGYRTLFCIGANGHGR